MYNNCCMTARSNLHSIAAAQNEGISTSLSDLQLLFFPLRPLCCLCFLIFTLVFIVVDLHAQHQFLECVLVVSKTPMAVAVAVLSFICVTRLLEDEASCSIDNKAAPPPMQTNNNNIIHHQQPTNHPSCIHVCPTKLPNSTPLTQRYYLVCHWSWFQY